MYSKTRHTPLNNKDGQEFERADKSKSVKVTKNHFMTLQPEL